MTPGSPSRPKRSLPKKPKVMYLVISLTTGMHLKTSPVRLKRRTITIIRNLLSQFGKMKQAEVPLSLQSMSTDKLSLSCNNHKRLQENPKYFCLTFAARVESAQ